MKAKAKLSNYRQHDTYKYTESEDIWILTNFENSNVICQWTQQNFKCSDCNNKQVFRMIDSWLNLFYPRGSDIYNEKKKHLSPLYPTGNHMTSVKNKNSLFLIPTWSNGQYSSQKKKNTKITNKGIIQNLLSNISTVRMCFLHKIMNGMILCTCLCLCLYLVEGKAALRQLMIYYYWLWGTA